MRRASVRFFLAIVSVALSLAATTWGTTHSVKIPASSNTNQSCKITFIQPGQRPDGTKVFLSYLGHLWNEKLIGPDDLKRMLVALNRGVLENPLSENGESNSFNHATRFLHFKRLQEFLNTSKLNLDHIQHWIKNQLTEADSTKMSRNHVQGDTEQVWQKMEFRKVRGGEIVINKIGYKIPDMDVLSTLVTQKMWFDYMGENPAYHTKGPDSNNLLMPDGRQIEIQFDYPIEHITVWSAFIFANRVSESDGLPPAYDFRGVDWTGDAAKGTLRPVGTNSIWLAIDRVQEVERVTDHFQGFRIPTLGELAFLRSNRGRNQTEPLMTAENANEYAWTGPDTHSVTDLGIKSLSIDKMEFRDLFGNVSQLTGSIHVKNGSNLRAIIVGAATNPHEPFVDPARNTQRAHDERHTWAGFRLVRTLK